MKKIRIAIAGYGNLGRGAELAVGASEDMELVGIFTRRGPESVKSLSGAPVYKLSEAKNMRDKILRKKN